MLGRRGPISKIVGNTIGLTKEYQADRKARKEDGSEHQDNDPAIPRDDGHEDDDEDEDGDDEAWAQELDAAQLATSQSIGSEDADFDEGGWMDIFIKQHPPPAQSLTGPLSMPVIIPERRAGFKTRGFVRAYAPVLQEAGIDETTWVELLKGFEKSINKHKWFHVVNAAVWVAGKVRLAVKGISVIARFVTMAIHLSIEAGRRGYMNVEQNKFLDRMNDDFFKPRGLYCLVIKHDPKSNEPEETIDVTTNAIQKVAKRDDKDRAGWKNLFQGTAGKVQHEEEIPEFAPLVFPELDKLDENQKQNAVKRFGQVMGEYYGKHADRRPLPACLKHLLILFALGQEDRRGQAKFDAENKDSKLAGATGEHEFASRYSDPNHPASTGGLVSTFTGGNVQYTGPLQKITDRRNARRSKLGISRQAGAQGRKQRRDRRPMRKFLKQDVLYLMVVNMPTKDEMDAVLSELGEANRANGQTGFSVQAVREALGLQRSGGRPA